MRAHAVRYFSPGGCIRLILVDEAHDRWRQLRCTVASRKGRFTFTGCVLLRLLLMLSPAFEMFDVARPPTVLPLSRPLRGMSLFCPAEYDSGRVRGVLRDVHKTRPSHPQHDILGVQVKEGWDGLERGKRGRQEEGTGSRHVPRVERWMFSSALTASQPATAVPKPLCGMPGRLFPLVL